LLPASSTKKIFQKFPRLADISTVFGYVKVQHP
jgi:hypothetical protein